ncbi:MAG: hypothetical protein AAB425_10600, partial [Bdellovibrionota bacterium]
MALSAATRERGEVLNVGQSKATAQPDFKALLDSPKWKSHAERRIREIESATLTELEQVLTRVREGRASDVTEDMIHGFYSKTSGRRMMELNRYHLISQRPLKEQLEWELGFHARMLGQVLEPKNRILGPDFKPKNLKEAGVLAAIFDTDVSTPLTGDQFPHLTEESARLVDMQQDVAKLKSELRVAPAGNRESLAGIITVKTKEAAQLAQRIRDLRSGYVDGGEVDAILSRVARLKEKSQLGSLIPPEVFSLAQELEYLQKGAGPLLRQTRAIRDQAYRVGFEKMYESLSQTLDGYETLEQLLYHIQNR